MPAPHLRKPAQTSDRAACLHLGHARPPRPTLASTRAAWLREGQAWRNKPVPGGWQAAFQRSEDDWYAHLPALPNSDRAAVLHMSRHQFEAGRMDGTGRYYLVLFGHKNGIHIEIDTAYLLLRAREIATSAEVWYQASHLVAEANLKIDAGIQGKIEGLIWGVKTKADINVVKADLLDIKADFTKSDPFSVDYAGKNGTTKISNGLALSADVSWLPKSPWGAVSLGGMVEQSQLIDKNYGSTGYKQDYGLYIGVPLYQSKSMKTLSDNMKLNPATVMGKAPGMNAKIGKPKKEDFVGGTVGVGAALLVGFEIKFKGGLAK